VPVAGLTQVLTGPVILSDHPLSPGSDGPDDPDHSRRRGGVSERAGEPRVRGPGRRRGITYRALGSRGPVGRLGDRHGDPSGRVGRGKRERVRRQDEGDDGQAWPHVDPHHRPSGADPATTSTAAISIPVLRQIVSLGQASVPMTTVVYNLNSDLGQDGIIAIKTGSDSSTRLLSPRSAIRGRRQ
jgi:D-alanyl-D-alanine carboxypeptidase (penicillin-binding protein 5/6)